MDLNFLYSEFRSSSGISTDTRKIKQNQLFFALRGPNFNANELAGESIAKGARLAVIDDPSLAHISGTYLVKDSLVALQQLATHHRDHLKIPFIGLTGSNGKTTTKELIRSVLETKYKVLATTGNLNNHIGVPLTLLSVDESHEIAVIEMGANHVGEIAFLCTLAKPTHGLITNIGKAHIGEFGGFENILRAKTELYDYLLKSKGEIFVNSLDPSLKNMTRRFEKFHAYPSPECSVEMIDSDPYLRIKNEEDIIQTQLIGSYNFPNIAAAFCIGEYFGVERDKSLHALQSYTPSNNRSQLIQAGSNVLLMDAYNANPSSMEVAVKNFSRMKAASKVVILGDMLELGEESASEHYNLGNLVKSLGFTKIIFVGPLMQSALDACPEAHYFEDKKELVSYLEKNRLSDSHILIKGSRGMALEQLTEIFKAH